MFIRICCELSLGVILLICTPSISSLPIRKFPSNEELKITYDMLKEITIYPVKTNEHSNFASGYFHGNLKRENLTRVEVFPSVLKFNKDEPDSQYMTQVRVLIYIFPYAFFLQVSMLLHCTYFLFQLMKPSSVLSFFDFKPKKLHV